MAGWGKAHPTLRPPVTREISRFARNDGGGREISRFARNDGGGGAARLSLLVGVFFTDQRPWISRPGCFLRFRLNLQNLLVGQREQIVQRALSVCRRRGIVRNLLTGLHHTFPFGMDCGCIMTLWLMARRCASARARTLAKPAGLVMRADWPASEFAQRLHSSNSTA